jgi:hypothetical protein
LASLDPSSSRFRQHPAPRTASSETGTFTNPALIAQINANPQNYYVNVHTTACPPGVIRGQLDEHGPSNN